ncbi:DUF3709 domain-containing protein [Vibrio cholerae]
MSIPLAFRSGFVGNSILFFRCLMKRQCVWRRKF